MLNNYDSLYARSPIQLVLGFREHSTAEIVPHTDFGFADPMVWSVVSCWPPIAILYDIVWYGVSSTHLSAKVESDRDNSTADRPWAITSPMYTKAEWFRVRNPVDRSVAASLPIISLLVARAGIRSPTIREFNDAWWRKTTNAWPRLHLTAFL